MPLVCDAEPGDARRDLADLLRRMGARIAGVKGELIDREVLDGMFHHAELIARRRKSKYPDNCRCVFLLFPVLAALT
jgi:hypothetical protein